MGVKEVKEKNGICVYDARVGVREEGEHFPQR